MGDKIINFELLLRECFFEICLKLVIAQLIALLKLPIVVSLDLNGVVCEVNHHVQILNIKLVRTCSNVAVIEPIVLASFTNENTKHKGSNIKFPPSVQQ